MYRQVGIFVNYIHEHVTNRKYHAKLFSTLADQRLFFCFSKLHLTANEFPKEASRLMRRALADHEFIALPNKCGNYFGYIHILIPSLFKY
jgi:hypothetical protein